jgi:tRNA(His) 5'-end guanylyltransferase
MAYTVQGGSDTFTNMLKKAGLDTPFDENCLKTASEAAKKWLDEFDLSEIA